MTSATRVCQNPAKVVTFYKNGDKYIKGCRIAITPRNMRNMETLLNYLSKDVFRFPANYVFTESGETVNDIKDFQNGHVYICSSHNNFSIMKYGLALPYWNSSKQTKGKIHNSKRTDASKVAMSPPDDKTRKKSDTMKARFVTVIRNGPQPRRKVKVLLNKRTAQTFEQVLDEITHAIGIWGTNGVQKLYNMKGQRITEVVDLFQEDDCFIAVGNEKFHLSDLEDVDETKRTVQKSKLPRIVGNTNHPRASGDKSPSKPKNIVKLPLIARKSNGMETKSYEQRKKETVNAYDNKSNLLSVNIKTHNANNIAKAGEAKTDDLGKSADRKHNANKQKLNSQHLESEKNGEKVTKVEDKYMIGEKVGDGNFAVVRIGIEKKTKMKYALKIIDRKKIQGKEDMLKDEIRIMKQCHHENIAQLYETYEAPFDIYLVMEYVSGGDLFDEISKFVKFEEPVAKSFSKDIFSALNYLHKQNIVHRDLKPENLLVHVKPNDEKQLKLADFGLAMEVKVPLFTVCGTPTYVAPEILEEVGYSLKVDIWAAGVIIYIMLCGFPPFRSPNRDQDELFDLISAGNYEFLSPYWDKVSVKAKSLIDRLLVVDTSQRYTAEQALNHVWLLEDTDGVTNIGNSLSPPQKAFNARRKFMGAAIAVKGSKRLINIAKDFKLKRDEKIIA